MRKTGTVRPCQVCGLFYPSDPRELEQMIDGLLVPSGEQGARVRGLVAPHAGYLYSGKVAGTVYGRLLGSTYNRVVIISPSHAEYFEGASVYDGEAYATPLGEVTVDQEFRRLLAEVDGVAVSRHGHGREHALEVQIPFLQRTIGAFLLTPVVIGHQSPEVCFALGKSLAEITRHHDVLIVASTDLSHFHPEGEAHQLDEKVMARIRAFDETRLMEELERGDAEACGGGPVVALMTAMRALGYSRSQVVAYATSAETTGDRHEVVGYTGAVIA
jgi:AmmeMemoRadiSam system protein B